jgi:Family of unknown function (DUF6544)
MRAPPLSELERQLLRSAEPGTFTSAEVEGLPEPARRHLAQAIAPGTPLATSARLRMRGRIKIGRWLSFRARQVLDPHRGFVWAARTAGVITGSDCYVDGQGAQEWKLAGLVTVLRAEGPDISRSAAGRAGAEAIWVPTALLPRFGVRWTAHDDDSVTAHYRIGEVPMKVHYRLDRDGRIVSFVFDRWGDPDGTAPGAGIPSAARSPATAPSTASPSPAPAGWAGSSTPTGGPTAPSSATGSPICGWNPQRSDRRVRSSSALTGRMAGPGHPARGTLDPGPG